MVQCTRQIAAMQTNALFLVSGIPKLSPDHGAAKWPPAKKGDTMSKTASMTPASMTLRPSGTLFGRLLATIDRLLMKSAEIANRNGDLPRVGL
jgi:hypothetical protein